MINRGKKKKRNTRSRVKWWQKLKGLHVVLNPSGTKFKWQNQKQVAKHNFMWQLYLSIKWSATLHVGQQRNRPTSGAMHGSKTAFFNSSISFIHWTSSSIKYSILFFFLLIMVETWNFFDISITISQLFVTGFLNHVISSCNNLYSYSLNSIFLNNRDMDRTHVEFQSMPFRNSIKFIIIIF